MIIATVKGNFSFSAVAQELRNQWADDDLRRRDQQGRSHGLMANDDDGLSEDAEDNEAWMMDGQLSEEGQALVSQAQDEIFEAQAKIDQGRRTLRQARARQHQVRMSRRYYKTSYHMSQPDRPQRSSNTGDTCLKCGGRHKTSDCRQGPSASMASETEAAPFVRFSEQGFGHGRSWWWHLHTRCSSPREGRHRRRSHQDIGLRHCPAAHHGLEQGQDG